MPQNPFASVECTLEICICIYTLQKVRAKILSLAMEICNQCAFSVVLILSCIPFIMWKNRRRLDWFFFVGFPTEDYHTFLFSYIVTLIENSNFFFFFTLIWTKMEFLPHHVWGRASAASTSYIRFNSTSIISSDMFTAVIYILLLFARCDLSAYDLIWNWNIHCKVISSVKPVHHQAREI